MIVAVGRAPSSAGSGYALAHELIDGWLRGEPAPSSVVANFESYTPQLGFRPDSGRAVLVAADGGVSLYATTNDRGSYCLAATAPDGGICVSPAAAAAPLIAGIMPDDPNRTGARRVIVAGRAANPSAQTIRFNGHDETVVTRLIGSSGFFVAVLPIQGSPCANGDWKTTFAALGANDEVVSTATITIAHAGSVRGGPPVCSWANGPHP